MNKSMQEFAEMTSEQIVRMEDGEECYFPVGWSLDPSRLDSGREKEVKALIRGTRHIFTVPTEKAKRREEYF